MQNVEDDNAHSSRVEVDAVTSNPEWRRYYLVKLIHIEIQEKIVMKGRDT